MKRTRIVLFFLIVFLLTACQSLASTGPNAAAAISREPARTAVDIVSRTGQKPGQPINIALDAKFSASGYLPNYPPENILAQAPDCWAFKGGGPAWFQIDLPHPSLIRDLRFSIDQYQGEVINVMGQQQGAQFEQLATLTSKTFDYKTGLMQFTPQAPWKQMQTIRLEMAESPPFPCWRGLELIGPIPEHAGPYDIRPPFCGHGSPDLIYHNADIVTMDPAVPTAEAVAVEDGWIMAVGDNADILDLAVGCTEVIDLGGRTLVPGFIDSHSHWIGDRNLNDDDPTDGIPTADYTVQEAADLAASYGWTSINELFVNQVRLDELVAADTAGELPVRVNGYFPANYRFDKYGPWYLAYTPRTVFSPHVRVPGIKLFMDGGGWGRDQYWTQDELNAVVLEAHDAGWQIATHAVAPAGVELILNALEAALGDETNAAYRHRIEHAIKVSDAQFDRIEEKGFIVSFQMKGPADWPTEMDFIPDLYDPAEEGWLIRWRDFVDGDMPTTGSTDFPWMGVDNPTPLYAIYESATRDNGSGRTPAPWELAQTITIEQGMQQLTINGAYATFEEGVKGTISPGKYADFVLLSGNPLEVAAPADLLTIDTLMTMVGGEAVYCLPAAIAFCP